MDGVVALLDGPAIEAGQFAHDIDAVDRQRREDDGLDHETPLAELFEDQLACADLVVINKADLLSDDGLERVKSSVARQLRPGVSAIATEMGAVDPLAVLGIDAAAEADPESRSELHHHHGPEDPDGDEEADHDHDEFDSVAIELPEITRPDAFLSGLGDVMRRHGLLRVKGFAAVAGKPMRLVVQAVGPRVNSHYDRPFGTDEGRRDQVGCDRCRQVPTGRRSNAHCSGGLRARCIFLQPCRDLSRMEPSRLILTNPPPTLSSFPQRTPNLRPWRRRIRRRAAARTS